VSTSLVTYRPDARVSEAVSVFDSRLRDWGLGVNFEDTVRNVSDSVG
jgi:hypothetical protein